MDFEKKYKDALERAKKEWSSNLDGAYKNYRERLEIIFPELAESEDERIRKQIISFLKEFEYDHYRNLDFSSCLAWLEKQDESKVSEPNWCHHKVDLSDCSEEYRKAYYDGWNNCNMQHSQCNEERNDVVKCLINGMKFYYEDNEDATWGTDKWSMPVKHIIEVLEKQGEHKSVDKVEPKFQNGQWVVWQNKCYKVNYNGCGYELIDQNGLTTSCEYGTIDENAHLWTIEDAKDGDVLAVTMYSKGTWIGIFKNKDGCTFSSHCFVNTEGTFKLGYHNHGNGEAVHPATKEQCDTLERAITNAGYRWDKEKLKLEKI